MIELNKGPHWFIHHNEDVNPINYLKKILQEQLDDYPSTEIVLCDYFKKLGNECNSFVKAKFTEQGVIRSYFTVCQEEMQYRYELFSEVGVKNLKEYNALQVINNKPILPPVVVVITDYILHFEVPIEESEFYTFIKQMGQKARSVGISLLLVDTTDSLESRLDVVKRAVPSSIEIKPDKAIITMIDGTQELL